MRTIRAPTPARSKSTASSSLLRFSAACSSSLSPYDSCSNGSRPDAPSSAAVLHKLRRIVNKGNRGEEQAGVVAVVVVVSDRMSCKALTISGNSMTRSSSRSDVIPCSAS